MVLECLFRKLDEVQKTFQIFWLINRRLLQMHIHMGMRSLEIDVRFLLAVLQMVFLM